MNDPDDPNLPPEVLKGMQELRTNLLSVTPMLQPIYEWGKGQKAALQSDGWSVGVAEQIAMEAVKGMIAVAFKAVAGQ